MNKTKSKNKCYWCGSETDMPIIYHAMGPLQVKDEILIQGFKHKYGKNWWDSKEIEPKLLEEVSIYDQITNTVSKGIVCADCLDKDDEMYEKFRKNGTFERKQPNIK